MANSSIDDGLRVAPLKIQAKEPPKLKSLSNVVVFRETDGSNQARSSEQSSKMLAVEVPEITPTRTPYPSVDTTENEDQGTVRKLPTRCFNTNESNCHTPTDTSKNTYVSSEQQSARPRIEPSTSYTSLLNFDVLRPQAEAMALPHPQPIKVTTREAVKERRRQEKADRKAGSLRKRAVRRLRGRVVGDGRISSLLYLLSVQSSQDHWRIIYILTGQRQKKIQKPQHKLPSAQTKRQISIPNLQKQRDQTPNADSDRRASRRRIRV